MAIKALDPIAELGVARDVKLLQARRPSGRPAQPDKPKASAAPNAANGGALEAEQAKKGEQAAADADAQSAAQNPSLRFHVDQDTGKTVAELVDPNGQVLRQMPTEEALEIAKAIGKYQGMFVDLKV